MNCSEGLVTLLRRVPAPPEAGTLEVRGAFFTLFNGKLKILGDDGVFRDSPITGAAHSTTLATTSSKFCTGARHTIHRIGVPALATSSTKRRPSCVDFK